MNESIAIIGTMDTKGDVVAYIKKKIEEKGKKTFVIDCGILGPPTGGVHPDITREDVARAGGYRLADLVSLDRGPAVEKMIECMRKIIPEIYLQGRFQGVISVGGAEGSLLATAGMQKLPLAVPKLLISSVASGNQPFGPWVGTKDIMVMHSVVDILIPDPVSTKIYDLGVAAIVGMVEEGVETRIAERNLIGATMYGNTTPLILKATGLLDKEGYKVVILHPYGTGGRNFEEMIDQGFFVGTLDVTLQNITEDLFGGIAHPEGEAKHRLEAGARAGIPQVIVPGCTDMIEYGALESIPARYSQRRKYQHNPMITLIRTTKDEMHAVADTIATKLNQCKGPCRVVFPLQGLSMYNKPGLALYDPEADRALLDTLKKKLDKRIGILEVDANINDDLFAKTCVTTLLEMLKTAS